MSKLIMMYCVVLTTGLQALGQNVTEIAKREINSTVSIVAFDQGSQPLGYGSGFIFDDELIATNIHVIEGSNSVSILINGESKKYSVSGYVAIDEANDLVILKVAGLYGTKMSLATEALPEIGERIYAIGNPKGFNGTFSEGIVSGVREIEENQVLQITAPISPGSSGGPVINSSGQVVGIAFASYSSGQNLNFAIPVKYLLNLKKTVQAFVPLSNIKSKSIINTPITQNIKDGVTIRNVELCHSYFGETMVSFSIKNNLNSAISDIVILFLGYDATGEIVDYFQFDYRKSIYGEIMPLLAKSVSCPSSSSSSLFYLDGFEGKVTTVKPRVLDFRISNE